MKTKIVIIIAFLSVICQTAFCQSSLKKETIKSFAAVCWFHYRFGNTMFITTMNSYLPYRRSDVAILMENLDTKPVERDEVLKVFYRVSSGIYESLFANLYSLRLEAHEAKELANYAIYKFGDKPKPTVLFKGVKKFTSEDKDLFIEIKGNKIEIVSTPKVVTHTLEDFTSKIVQYLGTVSNGKVLVKGQEFEYKDGYWLHKVNGRWVTFTEVKADSDRSE